MARTISTDTASISCAAQHHVTASTVTVNLIALSGQWEGGVVMDDSLRFVIPPLGGLHARIGHRRVIDNLQFFGACPAASIRPISYPGSPRRARLVDAEAAARQRLDGQAGGRDFGCSPSHISRVSTAHAQPRAGAVLRGTFEAEGLLLSSRSPSTRPSRSGGEPAEDGRAQAGGTGRCLTFVGDTIPHGTS